MQPQPDGLLFSYTSDTADGAPGGRRAFHDGRVEALGPGGEWAPLTTCAPERVAELRREVLRALALSDEDRYEPAPGDGARSFDGEDGGPLRTLLAATFVLAGPNGPQEIVVAGWPDLVEPPHLRRLLDRTDELTAAPATGSVWRLWCHGEVLELVVDGDFEDVPALAGLCQALFEPVPGGKSGPVCDGTADPPRDVPLVTIVFTSADGLEMLALHADGRRIAVGRDGREQCRLVEPAAVAAVRAALAETDWRALPSRL